MGSIRLSPKHGVNPSIPTCFWCGEAMNMLVLFGRLPNDKKAGMHCGAISYEPCEKCKESWSKGIVLIEAGMSPQSENQPEMSGAYPTGKWAVMTREAASHIFTPNVRDEILKQGMCFMDFETFGKLTASAPEPA